MEYIYWFPIISLSHDLAPTLTAHLPAQSSRSQATTTPVQPSLNTSEALVRFS